MTTHSAQTQPRSWFQTDSFDVGTAYDTTLPIHDRRDEILAALRRHRVLVIAGETGSGKTTQLPLMCMEAGLGRRGIVCTQPRRIAATSIARYLAARTGSAIGSAIGYRIRFDQRAGPHTAITFVTDGILLTDIRRDRLLGRYDTIIVDEAHERSLNVDFLLGYLRTLLTRRSDLKVIISSATIDTQLFSSAFGGAPVIEVSGRLYPVEVIYQPLALDEDGLAEGYIEAAVRTVEELLALSDSGDILVFMPTEQDIVETVAALRDRSLLGRPLCLPLYGRMPSHQQNQIFVPHHGRTVIVATNIAETSLTVPNVRFVVDTGLARTVRYVPGRRTSRMPVERISQASANQRAGRCGRVRDGVCVRLYSADDYARRPAFTPPEIRRVNISGVVLQMYWLGLGPAENFPFLESPEPRALADAHALLADLGALTRDHTITPLGRRMAQLPLDPPVSRMLLQAAQEGALREVKVIAAALSVPDPRERPPDRRAEADTAHRRFADPMSDFLTYLRLWDAYHDQWETLGSQRRLRAFCREHFLSFNRMREWRDVYAEIDELCTRLHDMRPQRGPAGYEQIHRSLLAGLLHNTAMRVEGGGYRATRDRSVSVFPGSSLARASHPWIVCHEIVETSRVYARTVAAIKPEWIEQLAPHLCRRTYNGPYFDPNKGTVLASEQVTFFGLPIVKGRTVHYGRVNAAEAHETFVREALVEGRLRSAYPFLRYNLELRRTVNRLEHKLRTRSLYVGDDVVVRWYCERLPGVHSATGLDRAIRTQHGDQFLRMRLEDLITTGHIPLDNLPDMLQIGQRRYQLSYRFAPGDADDGVSVSIPESDLASIHEYAFEWVLPELWPRRVQSLLEHLPRTLRKRFVPIPDSAAVIAAHLSYRPGPFTAELRRVIETLYHVSIPADAFAGYEPEPHAWVRVLVTGPDGTLRYAFTPPGTLPPVQPENRPQPTEDTPCTEFGTWRRSGLVAWDFGDIPERLESQSDAGSLPLYGYPALHDDVTSVSIVVYRSAAEAEREHERGLARLMAFALAADLAWEERAVRLDPNTALLLAPWVGRTEFEERLRTVLIDDACRPEHPLARTAAEFERQVNARRQRLAGAGRRLGELASTIARAAAATQALVDTRARRTVGPRMVELHSELTNDLATYLRGLLEPTITCARLEQYPRYLAAFAKRVENAFDDPAKYRARRAALREFERRCSVLESQGTDETRDTVHALRAMVEEYAISLFAQQAVRTLFPVSEKRLSEQFAQAEAVLHKHMSR